ncbi:hypothetical protein [Aliivibrio sifiae]|uniref:Type IV pilus biogenesis protein PilP n=1 Tax=Aliivibrio sifiae TaxID=566293 RepID=A0A2S7X1P8_9GAMM|nr:hypothetical protein [Aliivibrio sifiae]PQJ83542.1 hypothetical protein BTO23_20595 [Aliivibrio sifiae]GLR76822.1 hypothetical protein GCM10007855_36970 [Aliivibrio sifiae]
MNTKKKIGYSLMILAAIAMSGHLLLSSIDNQSKSKTHDTLALQRQVWEQQQTQNQTPKAHQKTPKETVIVLPITKETNDILDSLQQAYASDIKTRELKAKIEEKKASQTYDLIANPPKAPVEKKPVINVVPQFKTLSMTQGITVKSIFKRDDRVVAWVELEGQLIPIKKGARLNHLVVDDITKNAVIFNDNGQRITRYMAKPTIKRSDNEEEEVNGIN